MTKAVFYLFTILLLLVCDVNNAQHIYVKGNQFFLDGDTLWLNGANTPWDNWNDLGGSFDYSWWNQHFSALHEAGINSTRIWLTCNGDGGVDINSEGHVAGPTNKFWKDMDSLMSIAKRHQVYVMGALISFDHTKQGNPKYLSWRNMFSSEANMNSFVENYAVPLVQRYQDNPYLFSLDVCNEILWISSTETPEVGNISWSALQYLVGKTAQRVHEESKVLVCVSNYIKYTSPSYQGNKWSDNVLIQRVGDPDAFVDFYKIHYYPWVAPWFDGFHADHTPDHYGIGEKPCISGEISAKGIYAQPDNGGSDIKLYSITEAYELHYKNGWQGAMAWTSNGVDVHGSLNELREATLTFQSNHPHLVGRQTSEPTHVNFRNNTNANTGAKNYVKIWISDQNNCSLVIHPEEYPEVSRYRVIDLTDRIRKENSITNASGPATIHFNNLDKGMYIVHFFDNKHSEF